MFRGMICAALALAAGANVAASAEPKDDLAGAIAGLIGAGNYSWTTTTAATGNLTPGPQDGKTQKDGLTSIATTFQDVTTTVYMKGAKAVVKTDSGYQTTEEIQAAAQGGTPNPAMFAFYMTRNLKLPADELNEWAGKIQNVTLTDGEYDAELDAPSAKNVAAAGGGRRAAGGTLAPIKDAKVALKFWIAAGQITKFEVHITATRTINDQDIPIDRDTTTEIKDVGSTKVDVPDDAKAKLNG